MMLSHLSTALTTVDQALRQGSDPRNACQTLGNVLQSLGRFEESMEWHTRAIQSELNQPELFACLGRLYAQQQQWPEAIAAYQQVLTLQPSVAAAHLSLANIYSQLGQTAQDIEHRQRAMALNPRWDTAPNYLSIGNQLLTLDRMQDAIAAYREAIARAPDFFEGHYNLAVTLLQQGQSKEAIAAYRQALAINPDHVEALYGLAKALEQQHHWSDALACYRRAVELQPDGLKIVYSWGELLIKQQQWDDSVTVCRRAVDLSPTFPWGYHNLGYALLMQGDFDGAIAAFQQAIVLKSDSVWTSYHLGRAFLEQQHYAEAVPLLLEVEQQQPGLGGIYPLLGLALRRWLAADREAAMQMLQSTPPILEPNRQPEFYRQLGQALANHQQYAAAIACYQTAQALQHEPETETLLTAAETAEQQLQRTIATHRAAIAASPQEPSLYTHLINALGDQGEADEAIALNRQVNLLYGWEHCGDRTYRFTRDWFSYNIPTWTTVLQPLMGQPDLQVLEIGSYEGRSTCWLLDHLLTHPTSQITCIDLFFQERFAHNITQTGRANQVKRLQGNSLDLLKTLPSHQFDVLYVDGCHYADHVLLEALLCWPLLKPSGILIFDDYEWSDPAHPDQDTHHGIDAFLDRIPEEFTLLHKGYQLILQKSTAAK